ncbi:saccharopine dehydrogenase [Mycena olivaceomarginata]|nr:saccharopine dehydrogenase [Mycena olivaceomarginata]
MLWFHIEARSAGCKLVENSWPTAPTTATIIGLKELEESTDPLPHTHIQFAHCYKNQAGCGSTLYDLEFLTDASGCRITAFGFHAGFAGAAAGALALSSQKSGEKLKHLQLFENDAVMVASIKQLLRGRGKGVKVLVIGALGRYGRGAVDLFRKIGLEEDDIVKWDMNETAKGGPFQKILNINIFVNCIYLNSQIPSFLSIIVDISCDTTNPFNLTPICSINTTFVEPTVPVNVGQAISDSYTDLLLSLLEFPNRQTVHVWTNAEKLVRDHIHILITL